MKKLNNKNKKTQQFTIKIFDEGKRGKKKVKCVFM